MDKIVVITGAASGLGLSLSKKFVEAGETVYGVTRTQTHWKAARKAVSDSKHFLLYQVDLTQEKRVRKFLSRVYQKSRRIDILINSAGYCGPLASVGKVSLEEFQKHLSHNLFTAFLMCKHSIPYFKKQERGVIINISSMAGKRAVPGLAAYSASKFGILALSQCVAKENVNNNLRCITICPGGMNTPMRAKIFGKSDAQRQQTTDFVADIIFQVACHKIKVESGGDMVIRHGKISAINPSPEA